jgi:hypothetical protein
VKGQRQPGQECVCNSDCSTNTCVAGVCCMGAACGAKRPSGTPCDDPTDCESNFCADGICCNVACTGACVSCKLPDMMGECTPVPAGAEDPNDLCKEEAVDTCGQSGFCNGQGGCAKYAAGTVCKEAACQGTTSFVPASTCDGDGTCIGGVAISCAPSTCADNACRTVCTVAGECQSPATCTNGSCGPRGPGQDCMSNSQCQSGFCVEGVCCNTACTGGCQTCALPNARGTCTPVPAGQPDTKGMCVAQAESTCGNDGKCDGKGGCQKWKDGTVCKAASCSSTANTETPQGTCKTGRCETPSARSCAPYKGCTGTRCLENCGSDGQCTSGNFCNGGSCGKRPNGAQCSAANQCASNICAQGRCCSTACSGVCQACNASGTCVNVPTGQPDPNGACPDDACSNGCSGTGTCRREPNTKDCSACADGSNIDKGTCNGNGTCNRSNQACPADNPICAAGKCGKGNCTAANCAAPCKVCSPGGICVNAPGNPACTTMGQAGTCSGGSCMCTPKSCPDGWECGSINDCGTTKSCGTCQAPNMCNTSMHVCQCTPSTCPNNFCGMMSNGCGGQLTCGCPPNQTCNGTTCGACMNGDNRCQSGNRQTCTNGAWGNNPCPQGQMCTGDGNCTNTCVPKTCAGEGYQCGMLDPGCGGNPINCGGCDDGMTCNSEHKCVCVPKTCQELGRTCGMVGNGCGGTLNCGGCADCKKCSAAGACENDGAQNGMTCSPPQGGRCDDGTCKACVPKTCQELGRTCGSADNGCGGTVNCGGCADCKKCSSGGACEDDAGQNGMTCSPPQGGKCDDGACKCVPKTCQELGRTCGSVDNGCGGTLNCGGCGDCQMCNNSGACVADGSKNGDQCSPPQGGMCQGGTCQAPQPVDCQVSGWDCGTCTAACNRMCTRTITRPPANGGEACPELTKTESCTGGDCPPDPQP